VFAAIVPETAQIHRRRRRCKKSPKQLAKLSTCR